MEDLVTSMIGSSAETLSGLEHKIKWVVCPICRDEWTKLRPCGFISENRLKTDWMCVQCAESLSSFQEILKRYPLDLFSVEMKWFGSPRAKIRIGNRMETYEFSKNRAAILTFQNLRIVVRAMNHPPFIRFKVGEEEQERFADNILDAISKIRRIGEEFCDPSA